MNHKRITELVKDSAVFGMGSLVTRAVSFLLIPVYTSYFSPADYGVLALVNMFGMLLMILVGLGQHSAVFRFYFKYDEHSPQRSAVLSNYFLSALAMAGVCLLLIVAARPVAGVLLGDAGHYPLIVLIVAIQVFDLLTKIPHFLLRARRRTFQFVAFTIGKTLTSIGLILLFVVGLRRGVFGSLLGQAMASGVFMLLLFAVVARRVRPRLDLPIMRDMLRFGLPLVVGFLLEFVFRFSNRYFLKVFADLDEVGLFSLASRFGEAILLLNTAVHTAWPVFLYRSERERDAPRLYSRALTYYLGLAGLATAVLTAFMPEVYALMVDRRYHPSITLVPVLLLANVFLGVTLFSDVGIKLRERTIYNVYIAGAAALTALVLNLTLVPAYRSMGAAVATLLALALQAVLTLAISNRLYPLPFEWRRLLTLATVLAGATVAGRLVPWGGLWVGLAAKLALFAVGVPLTLWLTGFFNAEERRAIRRLSGRRFSAR